MNKVTKNELEKVIENELEKLIAKRPALYSRFSNWLKVLPN